MPTLTSKGQVTIPKDIRDRLGLKPGSQVEFVEQDGRVVVRRKRIPEEVWRRWRGYLKDQLPTAEAVDAFMEDIRGPRIKLDPEPPSDL
ncbi:MAG TPA: AbrB/MazE/SpoVT family DNA-binding domain-containing protein [Chloroflexota bacterium]|nr:AbrB/MazE/SpoVT family DNA-binding domain-containing protein [Chloroflexota bacterium]